VSGVGDRGAFTYKRSRHGATLVDRAVEHVLATSGQPYAVEDFSPYGYDERQYCSPGFDLPVGLFQRSQFGTFPEYHTSADNLDFIQPEHLASSYRMITALLEIVEQDHGGARQPDLGVALGRGRIAVDRAEIALPVDQRQAHRKILRHAHQRVVDRAIAVRVILTHHVADDPRRLDVFLVGRVALLVHRIKDAPVHRLEPVAHVGKCARHDHAHGVIEVRPLHFFNDRHGADIRRIGILRFRIINVGQGTKFPRESE